MRSPALWRDLLKQGYVKKNTANILLRASFSYSTSNDIGNDVSGLNDGKE
jgi:hypothetical protein